MCADTPSQPLLAFKFCEDFCHFQAGVRGRQQQQATLWAYARVLLRAGTSHHTSSSGSNTLNTPDCGTAASAWVCVCAMRRGRRRGCGEHDSARKDLLVRGGSCGVWANAAGEVCQAGGVCVCVWEGGRGCWVLVLSECWQVAGMLPKPGGAATRQEQRRSPCHRQL